MYANTGFDGVCAGSGWWRVAWSSFLLVRSDLHDPFGPDCVGIEHHSAVAEVGGRGLCLASADLLAAPDFTGAAPLYPAGIYTADLCRDRHSNRTPYEDRFRI